MALPQGNTHRGKNKKKFDEKRKRLKKNNGNVR